MGLPLWSEPPRPPVNIESSRAEFTRPRADPLLSVPEPILNIITSDSPHTSLPEPAPKQDDHGIREQGIIRELETLFRELLATGDRTGNILELKISDLHDVYRLILQKDRPESSAQKMIRDMMGVYRLEYVRENPQLLGQDGWEIPSSWLIERLWLGAPQYRNHDENQVLPDFPYPHEVPRLYRSEDRRGGPANQDANPDSAFQSEDSESQLSYGNSPVFSAVDGVGYDTEWTV